MTDADAMTPDAFDEKNHSLRVRLDAAHLSKIVDDYNASKGAVSRAYDWATDPERSAGEKALDVVGTGASGLKSAYNAAASRPGGQTIGAAYQAVGKPALRFADSMNTYAWAKAMGYPDATASMFAGLTQQGIYTPMENPAGELLARAPLVRESQSTGDGAGHPRRRGAAFEPSPGRRGGRTDSASRARDGDDGSRPR